MSEMISVVIPTYDRPVQLGACLEALAASRLPRERFEVVVVDDGGRAPLDQVVDRYTGSMDVRLERQENRGPAAARNRGAKLARGAWLAFIDDDCVAEAGWLSTLVRRAETHPGHMIGGRTVNGLERNPFSAASQHLVSYLYRYSWHSDGGRPWGGFFASNNLAVPAPEFRRLGGFDEGFPLAAGEDRDFCSRWSEHGLPVHYAPDALVYHRHPLTAPGFFRQHWNYGRGAFHFHRARARRGSGPVRFEPLSFYVGLLRFPFTREGPGRGALSAALLAVSQVANVAGYAYERWRPGRREPT